jgi:hypothetical protein
MKPLALPLLVIAVATTFGGQPTAQQPGPAMRLLLQRLPSATDPDPPGRRELELVQLDFTGTREIVHLAGGNLEIVFNPQRGPSITSIARYQVDDFPRGLVTGDFDGDRHRDIAVIGFFTERIEFLFGNGRGQFSRRTFVPAGFEPMCMAAGDFDGALGLDIAFAFRLDDERYALRTLFNQGGGRFEAGTDVVLASVPFSIVAADLNGDGSLDLALSNALSGDVAVLMNDGGAFQPPATYPVAGEPFDLEAADLNNDGLRDLVTLGPNPASISVLLNAGGGRFGSQRSYPADRQFTGRLPPARLALGDLTGDGAVDAMLSNGSLVPGRGDGTFDDAVQFDISAGTIAVRDIDGDGRLDIVADHDFASEPSVTLGFNRLLTTNRAPQGSVADETVEFGADTFFDARGATDPDGHLVMHEWRDELGRIAGTLPTLAVRRLPGQYVYSLFLRDSFGGETTLHPTWNVTGTAPQYTDIVLHASRATRVEGKWRVVQDTSAAGGARLHEPNAAAPRQLTPRPAPSSYFELRFKADASRFYSLWMRAKADGNSWKGDSVFVQFSGTVGLGDEERWRIGTADALLFSLEPCLNCGVSAWGWNTDGIANLTQVGEPIRFNDDERQTIRIQSREDGVSIDQIVLSSWTYQGGRAPGSPKRDTIILPRTQ